MKPTTWKKKGEVVVGVATALAVGGLLYAGVHILWGGETTLDFFKGIARNPMRVGALSPCSKFVAQEITRYVKKRARHSKYQNEPLRVLEVGAGSGIFTQEIARIFQNYEGEYCVDAVEIDAEYCAILENMFADDDHIHIHCADITTWDTTSWSSTEHYDVIITSVPFSNLSLDSVDKILSSYKRLIKPGGIISHVTLMLFPHLKPYLMFGEEKKNFIQKLDIVADFVEKFKLETVSVWLNITPVYVHHLQIT